MPEPIYNKPEAPGLHMGFDNTVALYHIVGAEDGFERAARAVFELLRDAQARFPDWPRVLYLDVEGHEGPALGFSPDLYELQQDFLLGFLGPFFTALDLPLAGGLVNPEPQRNDVPDRLNIGGDTRPHAGSVLPDAH